MVYRLAILQNMQQTQEIEVFTAFANEDRIYRSLLIFKHFIGLLKAAALLGTFPLNVARPELLQETIIPWKTFEERVCILAI